MFEQIPRFIPSITTRDLWKCLTAESGKKESLKKFSEAFAQYIGVSRSIPAPSGRAAFAGLLEAFNFPKGGEIILPALTFHAIPSIIKSYGLKPRFVDVSMDTCCMDITCIERMINTQTVAIMPVHMYGRACDMDPILKIAGHHKLIVIEDCAQACGARYKGQRLGSLGDAAIFSFHPHKNFPCLESGMAVTNSSAISEKLEKFMQQFPQTGYFSILKNLSYLAMMRIITRPVIWSLLAGPLLRLSASMGFDPIEMATNEKPEEKSGISQANLSMPGEIHGRIGLQLLKIIDELNKKRILSGEDLSKQLRDVPGIHLPTIAGQGENIYSSFIIFTENKKNFRISLRKFGVDTHGGNMFIGSQLPGLESDDITPRASIMIQQLIHLPIYPEITDQNLEQIVEAITQSV